MTTMTIRRQVATDTTADALARYGDAVRAGVSPGEALTTTLAAYAGCDDLAVAQIARTLVGLVPGADVDDRRAPADERVCTLTAVARARFAKLDRDDVRIAERVSNVQAALTALHPIEPRVAPTGKRHQHHPGAVGARPVKPESAPRVAPSPLRTPAGGPGVDPRAVLRFPGVAAVLTATMLLTAAVQVVLGSAVGVGLAVAAALGWAIVWALNRRKRRLGCELERLAVTS